MNNSTTPLPYENEPDNEDVRRTGKNNSDYNKMRERCPVYFRNFISTSSILLRKHELGIGCPGLGHPPLPLV
ncbi:hypothetical protein GJ496_009290 [Pomphorhynchus laevis]|nr:hypothetical protein GJ496_009290 [Pomphorhynchus laevis]